jgi:hypothetical protein
VRGAFVSKIAVMFLKGIGLGLGLGLCLAAAVSLFFKGLHPETSAAPLVYIFVVGFLIGTFGGWVFALQMILENLLSSLFLKAAELVPLPAKVVGEEWAKKMETFFREIVQPFPGFFRKFIEFFLITRFEDYNRINRALDKAKNKGHDQGATHQWMLMVILHYLLEPLWVFFYIVYAILLLMSCVLWSFSFIR